MQLEAPVAAARRARTLHTCPPQLRPPGDAISVRGRLGRASRCAASPACAFAAAGAGEPPAMEVPRGSPHPAVIRMDGCWEF